MQLAIYEAENKMAIKNSISFFYPYLHNSGINCLKKKINIFKNEYSMKR
jgi:hypothetical protein